LMPWLKVLHSSLLLVDLLSSPLCSGPMNPFKILPNNNRSVVTAQLFPFLTSEKQF
jgi:hypothetical protein